MGHGSSLVISTEDGDTVRESHFEGDEERHSFNGVVATVDIVTHEEVVGLGALASDLKQFDQVMELAVNVSANCDWGINFAHVRLINKDFFCLKKDDQRFIFEIPCRKEA